MHALNLSPSQCLEYFFKPDPIFQIDSEWSGNLAEEYKIVGSPCKKHDFANLIYGNDLNGHRVIKDGRDKDDDPLHRAAVDIPFAPPKSVSIMALHAGDNHLVKAHLKAVDAALDYIEKNYIFVRQTDNKNTVAMKTGTGLFAKFNHSVSRSNDPQLHSHTLLFNHTVYPRGHRAVFFDQLYKGQKLITQTYLSDMAKKVKGLDYEIELKGDGKWEIAGVKQEWIQTFSKRTHAIKKVEKDFLKAGTYLGAHEAKLRRISVLKSRPKKDSSLDEKLLKEQWEKEVPRGLVKKLVEQCEKESQPLKKNYPKDYIRLAYVSLHETECLFTKKKILENSLKLSVGHCTIADIKKGFSEMKANNEIVDVSKYINSKGLVTYQYTSKAMKETEQEILNNFRHDINASNKLLPNKKAGKIIAKDYCFLTNDQKNALQYFLTSKQQFMLVRGGVGTGEYFLFKSFKEILESTNKDIRIQGLGVTVKATQELQAHSGIFSKTIVSFLSEPVNAAHQNSVFIVNEASMLGSLQANDILDKAKVTNSKIIIYGDCRQLQAVSAGNFFKNLLELKTPYVEMNQISRQKNEHMLKTVGLIRGFQSGGKSNGIDEVFELFKKNSNITEIPKRIELLNSVVDAYLTSKQMDDTLVITAPNKDRLELNKQIRSELKKIGEIDSKNIQTETFIPINLPGIQRFFAQNYSVGQKSLIEQHNLATGEKSFSDATIVAITPKSNSLHVLTQHNELKKIFLGDRNIRTRVNLYESQQREFSTGDKVIFLKNNQDLDIQNGLTGKIEKIDNKENFHIRPKDSKRIIRIDPKEFPWLDHAYAISIHKSQGTTFSNVILLSDTRYKELNKTDFFYVAISKAERQVEIFTDDEHRLKEQFKEGQNKTSTLLPENYLEAANAKTPNIEKEIER